MRPRRILVLLAVLVSITFANTANAQVSGTFVRTADMTTKRSDHAATLLADGRVLITGGMVDTIHSTSAAELYDPSSGSFVPVGTMTAARWGHTATLLPDGRVLIAGGSESSVAELYDPITQTFTATGALIENRDFHAAVLLPNGKVLIAGGEKNGLGSAAHAELYDAETGTFALTGDYAEPFRFLGFTTTANVLPDGRVLIAGENPPEVYDAVTGAFSTTGMMVGSFYQYGVEWHAATSFENGAVLITGGNDDNTCGGFSAAEIYDPRSGTFRFAGTMTTQRDIHRSTLLHDGTVLLTGGGDGGCGKGTLDTAEVYEPARQSFAAVGKMTRSRSGHTATLLNDGTVLVAGGFSYWPYEVTRTAEIYQPVTQPVRRRSVGVR